MRHACEHCPRLAERPDSASLVRHWPLQLMHSAPCTNTSRSQRTLRREARDLAHVELARQYHARRAQGGSEPRTFGARDRHLRARVHVELGADLAREQRHRRVLHDQRIDAGARGDLDQFGDCVELALEHQRVQRQIELHARAVRARDESGQRCAIEVHRPRARVPAVRQPEVDHVRAARERGREGLVGACRREYFWLAAGGGSHAGGGGRLPYIRDVMLRGALHGAAALRGRIRRSAVAGKLATSWR